MKTLVLALTLCLLSIPAAEAKKTIVSKSTTVKPRKAPKTPRAHKAPKVKRTRNTAN